MTDHERVMSCRAYIYEALVRAMDDRANHVDWVERERMAVVVAANEWATAHPSSRTVSVMDVERVEVLAVGHVDYATKLALYVAELVVVGQ